MGRKNRAVGIKGRRGGPSVGKQRKQEIRSSLRKSTAMRPARTRFQWPRADPGRHLAPQGELSLIKVDYNTISFEVRENLHPVPP